MSREKIEELLNKKYMKKFTNMLETLPIMEWTRDITTNWSMSSIENSKKIEDIYKLNIMDFAYQLRDTRTLKQMYCVSSLKNISHDICSDIRKLRLNLNNYSEYTPIKKLSKKDAFNKLVSILAYRNNTFELLEKYRIYRNYYDNISGTHFETNDVKENKDYILMHLRETFKKIINIMNDNLSLQIKGKTYGDTFTIEKAIELIDTYNFAKIISYLKNTLDNLVAMYLNNSFDEDLYLVCYNNSNLEIIDEASFEEEFVECCECGAIVPYDEGYEYDGEYYCDDCYFEDHCICPNCGEHLLRYDAYYDDDSDEYYCQECYDELCDERDNYGEDYDEDDYREETSRINGYHSKSHPVYKRLMGQDETIEDLETVSTYGFELETFTKEHSQDYFTNNELITDSELIHTVERDGSLYDGGAEFISNVMTYRYVKENEDKIKELLSELRNMDYISHNGECCGLHFHLGNLDEDSNIKIVHFVNKNWEWFKKFSRRKDFSYCGKININYRNTNGTYSSNSTQAKTINAQLKALKDNKSYHNSSHSYWFIDNDSRTHTSEIRLMRGTLNETTFLATFYLINALVETARTKSHITFSEIKKYLEKHEDIEIVNRYCATRGIALNGHEQQSSNENLGGDTQCA